LRWSRCFKEEENIIRAWIRTPDHLASSQRYKIWPIMTSHFHSEKLEELQSHKAASLILFDILELRRSYKTVALKRVFLSNSDVLLRN